MNEKRETPTIVDLLTHRYAEGGARFQNWDAVEFLHAFGSAHAALLYAALFAPEFVEIEGAVFLKDFGASLQGGAEATAEMVRRARAGSPEQFKRFVDSRNWVELPYVCGNPSDTEEEYERLASLVVDAWRARLKDLYPERRFIVRVLRPEETGSVIGVGIETEN